MTDRDYSHVTFLSNFGGYGNDLVGCSVITLPSMFSAYSPASSCSLFTAFTSAFFRTALSILFPLWSFFFWCSSIISSDIQETLVNLRQERRELVQKWFWGLGFWSWLCWNSSSILGKSFFFLGLDVLTCRCVSRPKDLQSSFTLKSYLLEKLFKSKVFTLR